MVLRLQKSAPNSCGLLSGFRFSLALFASASLNCCALRFVFSLKKPPPCHLPAAATPHARRAQPPEKTSPPPFRRFSGGASLSFGGVRKATSLELRPVVPLPSLAQIHMFFSVHSS